MNKYAVTFKWYKDYYCTELLLRKTFFIKANTSEEAGHKGFLKLDKEVNTEEPNNLTIIDEISIRHINAPKRKHRKDRYNILYTL